MKYIVMIGVVLFGILANGFAATTMDNTASQLVILYSSDNRGEVSPCG